MENWFIMENLFCIYIDEKIKCFFCLLDRKRLKFEISWIVCEKVW